ncbi:DUF4178 domain-containing protein [Chitinophaga ginsengisoli]|uniref:Uncharacterized protein DUF4178 n=1 Tax=Chitinophaga ginsengisoli TaxID=363837 RepID=A0A2P8FZ18_9BACT|nr:DUF4178 domain-containing protein [Chitinophaga ginsengisoli]PSL26954.1 uncharacterized protein DUF4178 [Chitinophaga ginsengisoli]
MTEIPYTHQCPSCSNLVTFSSPHTSVRVCTCGTVLNRMTDGTIIPRPFHVIAEKASVIAPGTTGQWKGKSFRVSGRFRIWAAETVFSYWTIIFQDETAAYLMEGYGMYAILLPVATPPELAQDAIRQLAPGKNKLLNKEQYMLLRKDGCKKWDVEGELFIPECNSTFTTFDFSSSKGRVLHIIEYWSQVHSAFEVHYTDFTSLALEQTRPYESAGREFKCVCGTALHVATFPYAQSCGCPKCYKVYVFENGLAFVRQHSKNLKNSTPAITLGATGIIKGIFYKVIGFIVKEERNQYQSQWREYTLFNEQEGYAFLSEYDGHWIYLREQGKTPVPESMGTSGFNYDGKSFDLFNSYGFNIISAQGEFPGNAFNDGNIKCWEFISPPIMWNREQSPEEGIVWFKGWHVDPDELKKALGDAIIRPTQIGVGAVQPNGYIDLLTLVRNTVIAIGVLILLHLAITSGNSERQLFTHEIYFSDSSTVTTTVINDIHLEKRQSNLMLDIYAPVQNNWMEVEATLINTKTGTEYSASEGVEYYSGVEDGDRWSEGSQNGTFYINEVPSGDYTLKLEATRESTYFPVKSYTLTAHYDVANTRNLFICIGLLLLWPIFKYFSTYYSENKRWSNSPYSAFTIGEDD